MLLGEREGWSVRQRRDGSRREGGGRLRVEGSVRERERKRQMETVLDLMRGWFGGE